MRYQAIRPILLPVREARENAGLGVCEIPTDLSIRIDRVHGQDQSFCGRAAARQAIDAVRQCPSPDAELRVEDGHVKLGKNAAYLINSEAGFTAPTRWPH